MMMKKKAKLPPPMSGWQEMTGMGWADIDMKVSSVIMLKRMMVSIPLSARFESSYNGHFELIFSELICSIRNKLITTT